MSRYSLAIVLVVLLAAPVLRAYESAQKQPVYVGMRACAACHDGAGRAERYNGCQQDACSCSHFSAPPNAAFTI